MEKEAALYIHIPFCKQKCLYCDFPSFSHKERLMGEYTLCLCREIEALKEYKFTSIFIGGGTPTYLSVDNLSLLEKVIKKLSIDKKVEFTIEGNPDSFTEEKLKIFKAMGVNRLSIGLQAWQEKLLKDLGRIHNLQQFIDCFKLARTLGFDNINIDLMFGLPNQSLEDWKETLEKIAALGPEHISCYSLIIEEGTPFYRMYEDDKLTLPGEEVERDMYIYGREYLKAKGYHQYEISNFSKEGKECRHNLVYWNLKDYIGCGAAAHSYLEGYRYRNVVNIEQYISGINECGDAAVEKIKNTIEDDMEEFMFLGFRKIEGISISEFENRFKRKLWEVYREPLDKYLNNGLLLKDGDRIFLSERGIEISNAVMSDFILK